MGKAAESAKQAIDDTHKAAEQALSDATGGLISKRINGKRRGKTESSSRKSKPSYSESGLTHGIPLQLAASPTAWVALATLVVMEIVLGIDNLIFISILTNKLPEQHRQKARRIGIGMALILRLGPAEHHCVHRPVDGACD
jgi:hypothetical protein